MSTSQLGAVVGLVLGAVWAFAGFWGAVLTGVLAAVGYVVGLVVTGQVDLAEYLGHRHDRR